MAELRRIIAYHSDLYYNANAPELPDADYDALVDELAQLEAEHPELRLGDLGHRRRRGAPVASFRGRLLIASR